MFFRIASIVTILFSLFGIRSCTPSDTFSDECPKWSSIKGVCNFQLDNFYIKTSLQITLEPGEEAEIQVAGQAIVKELDNVTMTDLNGQLIKSDQMISAGTYHILYSDSNNAGSLWLFRARQGVEGISFATNISYINHEN